MSKSITAKSLLHGLICCLVVLICAVLIDQFYPIDKIITASVGAISMVLPVVIEKLANAKINNHDEAILEQLDKMNNRLDQLTELCNLNENSIIEVQSVLTCFNNPKFNEDLNQLKIDVEILKGKI